MNVADYKNYFKAFAQADADLLHTDSNKTFFARSVAQVASLTKTALKNTTLVLLPYEKRIKTNNGESHVWMKMGSVMVITKVKLEDFDGEWDASQKAEAILDRLYKKMYYDRAVALYGFDISSWYLESVGPIGDNHYGQIAFFGIKDAVDLVP